MVCGPPIIYFSVQDGLSRCGNKSDKMMLRAIIAPYFRYRQHGQDGPGIVLSARRKSAKCHLCVSQEHVA